jgi:hypothetical protein
MPMGELFDQRGFPDAGFAAHQHHAARACAGGSQSCLHSGEGFLALQEFHPTIVRGTFLCVNPIRLRDPA